MEPAVNLEATSEKKKVVSSTAPFREGFPPLLMILITLSVLVFGSL